MRIYSPAYKHSIAPKAFSLFPFFFAMASLSIAVSKHSILFYGIACLFGLIFVYTFFFSKYEKYLDTDKKVIVTKLNWLWFRKTEEESLDHFTRISISLGAMLPKSNWNGFTQRMTYDVLLVRKYTNANSMAGTGAFENFLLKTLIYTPQEAKAFAETLSKEIGFNIVVHKQLTEFLKYDLLNAKEF